MKTTVEIPDALLARARKHGKRTGRTLRALVEEGLRHVLDEPARQGYRLPDRSVGERGAQNPLESFTWAELRDEIYGGR